MNDKRVIITQLVTVWIANVFCGVHPNGVSDIYRSQDALGNYQFGYSIADGEGEHFRREGTDASGAVVGSYGLTDADGRHRVVEYIADENGFRAHVRTNEPGTASSNSAAVTVEKYNPNAAIGHLEGAATSVSSTSSRAPSHILDHPAFGTRLTPVSSLVPSRSNSADYSSDRVRADIQPIHKSSATIDDNGVYYPPIRAFPPLSPPLHQESPSDYYPHRDLGPMQLPGQVYQATPPRSDSIPRPYIPPYGGSREYPNVYKGSYPVNTGDRYPDVLVPAFQGSYPQYLDVPTSRRSGVGRTPERAPQEGFPFTARGQQPISTIDGISIPIPSSENPNLVLQAVPIENGIQAVQVDTSTGQMFRTFNYPVDNRQNFNNEDRFDANRYRLNFFQNNDFLNNAPNGYRGYSKVEPQNTDFPNMFNSHRPSINYPNGGQTLLSERRRVIPRTNRFPSEEAKLSTTTDRDLAILSQYLPNYNYGSQGYSDGTNFAPNEYPNGFQGDGDYLFGPRYYNSASSDRPELYNNYAPSASELEEFDPYPSSQINSGQNYQYPMPGDHTKLRSSQERSFAKQTSAVKPETTTKDP